MIMRIAMWSGPRNLSTAMMYSFGARGDCAISDEPFYAAYLAKTGLDHPMRTEILASQPNDPAAVGKSLAGLVPGDKAHWYQKHMPHHMHPDFPMDWANGFTHVHLIRHPARVIASYGAKRENPTLADLGYAQCLDFFERFPGPVIDSTDIRADPRQMLQKLCAEPGVPWTEAMLWWSKGGRVEDGAWASHWYGAVHRSTGFAGAEGPLPNLSGSSEALLSSAWKLYSELAAQKL